MKEKTKILLTDDQILFAKSLETFLKNYADDMEVIGIAENGRKAVQFVQDKKPDVILMDVRMPEMDGVEAVKIIHQEFPQIKIIMISTYDDDELVRNALRAGANGYLLKDISPTELIISIRALNSGQVQISPALAQKLIQTTYIEDVDQAKLDDQSLNKKFEWLKTLTKREREIFSLIATGHDNNDIAQRLGTAAQTVRNQVSAIYSKLGVKDRFEIIRLANKTT
ncbi:MAG: response regulator transcription factor [Treponema sp.]|nr:response regulator transcription factor [Treponema sp.]